MAVHYFLSGINRELTNEGITNFVEAKGVHITHLAPSGRYLSGYVKATLREILLINYVCSIFLSLFIMKDKIISMKLFLTSTT
jgi:hypothetical protein